MSLRVVIDQLYGEISILELLGFASSRTMKGKEEGGNAPDSRFLSSCLVYMSVREGST